MSTTITSSTQAANVSRLHTSKPSFFGLVRGELFKTSRQWSTWIMLVLFMGFIFLPYLIMFVETDLKSVIAAPHDEYFYSRVAVGLALIRVFGGMLIVIMAARVIGQEYSQGTIRIVLARGVGRVQFLLAKLLAIALWAIFIVLIGLVLNLLLAIAQIQIVAGNINALTNLNATTWHDLGVYVLTILASMAVTILMTTAITVLFRSLAGGLSASIAWFPADNIVVIILSLAFRLTKNDFWQNISGYLLGPNLNIMAGQVAGVQNSSWAFGSPPLVIVDGSHTLLVTAAYAVIFATAAIILTWKRDVKE